MVNLERQSGKLLRHLRRSVDEYIDNKLRYNFLTAGLLRLFSASDWQLESLQDQKRQIIADVLALEAALDAESLYLTTEQLSQDYNLLVEQLGRIQKIDPDPVCDFSRIRETSRVLFYLARKNWLESK